MRGLSLLLVVLFLGCGSETTTPGPGRAGGSGGGGGACPLTAITSATTQECYDCMLEKCCAEMTACDQDADCVYCVGDPTDTSERCIDPNTFATYEKQTALNGCQRDLCVPPCGVPGGSGCSRSNCHSGCPNFATGC